MASVSFRTATHLFRISFNNGSRISGHSMGRAVDSFSAVCAIASELPSSPSSGFIDSDSSKKCALVR